MRSVKISSPDVGLYLLFLYTMEVDNFQYVGWSSDDAVKHYLTRLNAKIPHFETMDEPELNYIKVWPTLDC